MADNEKNLNFNIQNKTIDKIYFGLFCLERRNATRLLKIKSATYATREVIIIVMTRAMSHFVYFTSSNCSKCPRFRKNNSNKKCMSTTT